MAYSPSALEIKCWCLQVPGERLGSMRMLGLQLWEMMNPHGKCYGRRRYLENIRMFLWRLAKHSLPTQDVRCHRDTADTNTCGLHGFGDSWRHSLIECSMERSVRAIVDDELLQHMISSIEPSAKNWLFTMIESLSHDVFIRLAVTLWAIWWARTKAIHEAQFQSPLSTKLFVYRFISELGETTVKNVSGRV